MKKSLLENDIIKFEMPEEIDLVNSQEIKKTVYEESIEKGYKKVILDFSKTRYIDSTGLGIIVAIHKQTLMNAGALALINFDSNIRNLLKMTSLDRIFNIFDSEKEAIEFLNK